MTNYLLTEIPLLIICIRECVFIHVYVSLGCTHTWTRTDRFFSLMMLIYLMVRRHECRSASFMYPSACRVKYVLIM